MAGRRTPARGRRAAPNCFEPEVPPNYVVPGESDVLSKGTERNIDDILTGKTELERLHSAGEYLRHLDKALAERPGSSAQAAGPRTPV